MTTRTVLKNPTPLSNPTCLWLSQTLQVLKTYWETCDSGDEAWAKRAIQGIFGRNPEVWLRFKSWGTWWRRVTGELSHCS